MASPNELCLSFLTWNSEISDFQYHQQIASNTDIETHKQNWTIFFQKNANYLRKNQMWSYALGIYFSWTYTPRRVSVHSLLSFFLTLREDIFWTQTTAFLLFWLLTCLISLHKMLFLFIREQQEAGCGIPTVRLCAWGQVPTAQPQWETQTIWIDCWAPLSQYLGLCLHFWDQP